MTRAPSSSQLTAPMDDEEAVDWGYDESEEEIEAEAVVAPVPPLPATSLTSLEVEALLGEALAPVEPPVASPAPAGRPALPATSTASLVESSDASALSKAAREPELAVSAASEPGATARTSEKPPASGALVCTLIRPIPHAVLIQSHRCSGRHSSEPASLDGLV